MLRADVGGVCLAWDLSKTQSLIADALLDPELPHSEVPHPADATPAANADGGRGVGEEGQVQIHAHVLGNGLNAQPLPRALDYSAELCLG